MLAAEYGHATAAKLLLDRGADVNAADNDGATALAVASHNGRNFALQVLLDRVADGDAADEYGMARPPSPKQSILRPRRRPATARMRLPGYGFARQDPPSSCGSIGLHCTCPACELSVAVTQRRSTMPTRRRCTVQRAEGTSNQQLSSLPHARAKSPTLLFKMS